MPRGLLDRMMSPRSFLVSRQNQPGTSSTSTQKRPANPSTPRSLPSPFSQQLTTEKKNDERVARDTDSSSSTSTSTNVNISAMAASKRRREADSKSPSPSPPRTTTTIARPTTPSNPVQIPLKQKARETAHPQRQHRHHAERRQHSSSQRPRDHTPDAIPPSVAALLAITSIPPPKSSRSLRRTSAPREKRMTVGSIIERSQESEKELSLTLSKGPLDLLLTAPEDLEGDDLSSFCDSNVGSALSTRTVSLESMPSLSESYTTDTFSSGGSPHTPSRRRKAQPTRRSLEPVSSPPGTLEDHPLSSPDIVVVDELDFRVFESGAEIEVQKKSRLPFKPLKSAFKSNLTASLRALRSAARSLSALNLTSIPPEDFLTRSILTLDPQVPFTDERRPPPLEEEPTAALRRYLNPTTSVRLELPLAATPTPKAFTASIQMQTYKIHRARSGSSGSGRVPYPSTGPSSSQTSQSPQQKSMVTEYPMPGPRQREMRENPDFIRIAVMEMAMRRQGKLDDQRPGRARWALPPRKTSATPYVIGEDGVPARWVATTHD